MMTRGLRTVASVSRGLVTGLTTRYVAVLVVLGALALSNYLVLQRQLWISHASGEIINKAGRQRMMSQRIGLLAAEAAVQEDGEARAGLVREMRMHQLDLVASQALLDQLVAESRSVPSKPATQLHGFVDRVGVLLDSPSAPSPAQLREIATLASTAPLLADVEAQVLRHGCDP
jgi:hypothetical protein